MNVVPKEWLFEAAAYGVRRSRSLVAKLDEEVVRQRIGLISTRQPPALQDLTSRAFAISPLLTWAAFRPVLARNDEANEEGLYALLSLGAAASPEAVFARYTRTSLAVDLAEVFCIPHLQVIHALQSIIANRTLPNEPPTTLGKLKFELKRLGAPDALYNDTVRTMRNSYCHRKRELRPDGVILFKDEKGRVLTECLPDDLKEMVLEQVNRHHELLGLHAAVLVQSMFGWNTKAGFLAFLDRLHASLTARNLNANLFEPSHRDLFTRAPRPQQEQAIRYMRACA